MSLPRVGQFNYSIWQDMRTEAYEVVRWHEGVPLVVQSNIRTWEKAQKALEIWRKREVQRNWP